MAKKKVLAAGEAVVLADLSMADLYAMYLLVSSNRNRGFGSTQAATKSLIDVKIKEVEEELYSRVYGFNPFANKDLGVVVIEGEKPEDVLAKLNIEAKAPDKIAAVVKAVEPVVEVANESAEKPFAVFKNG